MFNNLWKKNKADKYKGCLGPVNRNYIAGWAMLKKSPIPVDVDLFFDEKWIRKVSATSFRKDLLEKGIHPTGNCGFLIKGFSEKKFEKAHRIHVRFHDCEIELTNSPFNRNGYEGDEFRSTDSIFVFLHIPKTGGTSFRKAAETEFGIEKTFRDYGKDNEVTSSEIIDSIYKNDQNRFIKTINQRPIRFLSGHFPAKKYNKILKSNFKWCVFLRDPVQRVVSEYYHRKKRQGYSLDLTTFCQEKKFFNMQNHAISEIPLEDFYFMGLTEEYQQSIELFNMKSGCNFKLFEENLGRDNLRLNHEVDDEIKNLILKNNKEDLALYQHALHIFQMNVSKQKNAVGSKSGNNYFHYISNFSRKFLNKH